MTIADCYHDNSWLWLAVTMTIADCDWLLPWQQLTVTGCYHDNSNFRWLLSSSKQLHLTSCYHDNRLLLPKTTAKYFVWVVYSCNLHIFSIATTAMHNKDLAPVFTLEQFTCTVIKLGQFLISIQHLLYISPHNVYNLHDAQGSYSINTQHHN